MRDPDGHPVVAAALDWVMAPFAALRPRVVGSARGRVLEVGAGTGANFAHYGEAVTEVVAIEPDPFMRRRAEPRRAAAAIPITLLPDGAEDLPFDDASFDEAVLTWVLCTIPDAPRALREVFRVLKPGGTAHFIEHVVSRTGAMRVLQGAADPLWARVAGGCHLTRDAAGLLADAGFAVQVHRTYGGTCSPFPLVLGLATKPSASGTS
jgi:SAM-dependent methyltransferase